MFYIKNKTKKCEKYISNLVLNTILNSNQEVSFLLQRNASTQGFTYYTGNHFSARELNDEQIMNKNSNLLLSLNIVFILLRIVHEK